MWGDLAGVLRRLRAIILGAILWLVLMGLYLVPDLTLFLPGWVRRYPIEWIALVVLGVYVAARMISRSLNLSVPWVRRPVWVLDLVDALIGKLLERGLVLGFAGLGLVWLLAWLPHYLNWP